MADERPDPNYILQQLKAKRKEYNDAYSREMTAPDGSWMEGYSPSDRLSKGKSREPSEQRTLESNNPLSLDQDVSYFLNGIRG